MYPGNTPHRTACDRGPVWLLLSPFLGSSRKPRTCVLEVFLKPIVPLPTLSTNTVHSQRSQLSLSINISLQDNNPFNTLPSVLQVHSCWIPCSVCQPGPRTAWVSSTNGCPIQWLSLVQNLPPPHKPCTTNQLFNNYLWTIFAPSTADRAMNKQRSCLVKFTF